MDLVNSMSKVKQINTSEIDLIGSVYRQDHCSNMAVLAHAPQRWGRLSATARLVCMVFLSS